MSSVVTNNVLRDTSPDLGPDALFAHVYNDLRKMAERFLDGERAGQTLQPTALVHEAYLRLLGPTRSPQSWRDRRHFYTAAAEAMRRILVEAARRKGRVKRGGDRGRLAVDPNQFAGPAVSDEVLALEEALVRFTAAEPLIAQLVRLRFFGGLTQKEAAEVLDIPLRTANSHWAYARAWLQADMNAGDRPVRGRRENPLPDSGADGA